MSSSNNGHKVSYKRCQNVVIIIAKSDARFDACDASLTVVEDDGRAPLLKKPNHRPRACPSSRARRRASDGRARARRASGTFSRTSPSRLSGVERAIASRRGRQILRGRSPREDGFQAAARRHTPTRDAATRAPSERANERANDRRVTPRAQRANKRAHAHGARASWEAPPPPPARRRR